MLANIETPGDSFLLVADIPVLRYSSDTEHQGWYLQLWKHKPLIAAPTVNTLLCRYKPVKLTHIQLAEMMKKRKYFTLAPANIFLFSPQEKKKKQNNLNVFISVGVFTCVTAGAAIWTLSSARLAGVMTGKTLLPLDIAPLLAADDTTAVFKEPTVHGSMKQSYS